MKKLTSVLMNVKFIELIPMASALFIAFTVLFYAIDDPLTVLKGFLFAIFAIVISYCDAKVQIIPDILLIPVVLTGLIHVSWQSLAGAAISILMLIITLISKTEAFGGGDVKLLAAYGFVLGYNATVFGMLIGFILFLIRYAYPFIKKRQSTYSLAPCLSIGCFLAFILI